METASTSLYEVLWQTAGLSREGCPCETKPLRPSRMSGTCVVVGVGPGLGAAIARRFAKAQFSIGLVSRSEKSTAPIAKEIAALGVEVAEGHADVGNESELNAALAKVTGAIGAPNVLVYNASGFGMGSLLDVSVAQFESNFRTGCVGAFVASRAVLPTMLERGEGTLLFTGATASLRGSARFAPFAAGKFALRALAQSIAREFGPKGIHAAHVIIDGPVESEISRARGATITLQPDDVAEAYWHLHVQRPSAWTQELDLRPSAEKF
jgi:short-subunit dehydrogenase